MRVNTLRVIAIAMGLVLIDVNLFDYRLLPDFIGLGILLFCAVLMTDRAGRFARTAVVTALMLFMEVIRVFNLVEAASVVNIFSLVYLFLTVLLVITAADGIGQFGQLQGHENIPKMCDVTGHIYAATFVFGLLGMWFESMAKVFYAVNLIITVFVLIMFVYFYTAIYVAVQEPFDPPPELADGGEEAEAEEETVGAGETL
jgi:hypothetical protein